MMRDSPILLVLIAVSGLAGTAASAQSFDIGLPQGAELVQSTSPETGGHVIATAPWADNTIPTRTLTGAILRETWQAPITGVSVQGVAADLAEGIASTGLNVLLHCHAAQCGGYDFRAGLDLGPSPEMYVDIGNYSYISALAPDDEIGIAITVSTSGPTLFIHAVQVAPQGNVPLRPVTPAARTDIEQTIGQTGTNVTDRIQRLPELGAVTLDDLSFTTGASDLSGRDYPSLVALAAFLADNPTRRIMLVGHTDSEGSLEGNVRLSEARANAVRTHLVEELGVAPQRVEAAGIGFLAPRATNDTAAGREANRRVEAVLLDTP